jgi:arsenite oxidase small subunit
MTNPKFNAGTDPISDHDFVPPSCGAGDPRLLLSRRQFLFGAGAATVGYVSMPAWLRRGGMPAQLPAQIAGYPRQLVGQLSQLREGEAVSFKYPWDHPNATNVLIKLGQPAGGGVGPDSDVVAFSSFCTHQGASLAGTFKASLGVAGPCPLHWTTFDLTRHGMVVSGHATLGLPQVMLEIEGDDIYATGVLGLIFGYYDNLVDPIG